MKESPEQQADIARDAGSVTPIHDDTVQPPPPILSVLDAGRIWLPRRALERRPRQPAQGARLVGELRWLNSLRCPFVGRQKGLPHPRHLFKGEQGYGEGWTLNAHHLN